MRVTTSLELQAPLREVLSLLTSHDLAASRLKTFGVEDFEFEVDSSTSRATFFIPASQLPENVRAFVRTDVPVLVETTPIEGEVTRVISTLHTQALPLAMSISVLVEERENNTVLLTYLAEYSISVPLFGSKLEKATAPWVTSLLNNDGRALAQMLSEHR